jgi:DNA invertase Pin-like site-specific DNA recombinase
MTGKRIGYIRVSTFEQNPDRQLDGMVLDKRFIEFASAKNTNRPQLELLMDYVRDDDILFVHSVDRLARNARDLCELVDFFVSKGVTVNFVRQNLIFNGNDSPMSKFQLAVMGAVAELEREISLERQREGIALAKKAGKYKGRKSKITEENITYIKQQLRESRDTKTKIAKDLGISRTLLYQCLRKNEKIP